MSGLSSMQAMILAAGLGTRLRPYSALRPKPIFPVLNQPLILHTIDQLRKAGFRSIVINAFHLRQQIVDLVGAETDILVQEEEILLGTGGGLKLARKHFTSAPILVVNGDICHSIDLKQVIEQHIRNRFASPVSLVLHDYECFNSVTIDSSEKVLSFDKGRILKKGQTKMAFTGIHVIDPLVFDNIPPGVFYNIIDCYNELMRSGVAINGIVKKGHFWTDMGTPEDYLAMHRHLLTVSLPDNLPVSPSDSPFLIHESANIGLDVKLNDWVCIGAGAQIGDNADLAGVVVWDGAEVPKGAVLRDTIVP